MMTKPHESVTARLDPVTLSEIITIRQATSRRDVVGCLSYIFNQSVLADEWLPCRALELLSGIDLWSVVQGLSVLKKDRQIVGTRIRRLDYFDAASHRPNRAAHILIGLAAADYNCPPENLREVLVRNNYDREPLEHPDPTQDIPLMSHYHRRATTGDSPETKEPLSPLVFATPAASTTFSPA